MAGQGPHRLPGAPPSRSPGTDLGGQPSLRRYRRLHPVHLQGCGNGAGIPPFRLLSASGPRRDRRQRLYQHRGRGSVRHCRNQPDRCFPDHELPLLHRNHVLLPRLHAHVRRGRQSPLRVSDLLPSKLDLLDRGRQQRGDHALPARRADLRLCAGPRPEGWLSCVADDRGMLLWPRCSSVRTRRCSSWADSPSP